VYGVTYKEDVPDIRNSKVPDLVRALERYGLTVLVHDPIAPRQEVEHEYGLSLVPESELKDIELLVLAVPHRSSRQALRRVIENSPNLTVIGDIKACLTPEEIPPGCRVWRL
jgi:UDP-N-acetyl-D-galactosamine dehydrogenase